MNVRPPSDVRQTQSSGTTYSTQPAVESSKEAKYSASPQSKRNIESNEAESDSTSDNKHVYLHFQAVYHKAIGTSSEKSCGANDLTRYALLFNHVRANLPSDTQRVEAKNLGECAKACDQNEKFVCLSAVLTDSECELSASSSKHKTSDDFVFSENSTYLEKTCLPASLAKDTLKLWPTILDHILVGHVMEVVDVSSLRECQIACLRAEQQYSFKCRSAMWYPNDVDQNCLLNSESRETQPNVFVTEDQGVRMLYFEIPRIQRQKQKLDTEFLRDDPIEEEFTGWTMCNDSGRQHRYLKCKEQKDVRKCPKQSKNCEKVINNTKRKCLAVRDSHGRKKCPHGIRKLPDGRTEYCRNPADCEF
ncbi:unnamed protein product [Gongylonema pulchrum]|uniref:Apple domain-containing protein n=1 Tax=Gongylonema pulchrum TaxID=637853 RepID=A0A3P7LQ98_9BILA|nr:unnamed protein product [Gongylonema pulchrum]